MIDRENARAFIRSNISIAARVTPVGQAPLDVMVLDLSMNGILVQTSQLLPMGSQCQVEILIGHYMHELPLCAEGIVIRATDNKVAICFNTIGIETSEEFESLILFHSDNPEQCLQEFEKIKAGHPVISES